MLQDSVMEKTKNRSVQPLTKGLGTDSKKNQDVASNKFWPKSGRRREPVNTGPPKNDSYRKPVQQRNRFVDKRPKPRGNYYPCPVGGKENAGLDTDDPELGSVFLQGSKKQSLNHLLNFHYAPRGENWGNFNGATVKHGPGNNNRWMSTHKHKYNKEQFLQANCQFIVNADGDYSSYTNNPDVLVNWDLVEQIHVQVSEFPSCPICLYSPVAAKMTRCGHVYCWSCVLHYLALSEKSWHKCPICYEAVHKSDLKSVVAIAHKAFNIGEHIKFRLMRREKGSFTPIPVEEKNSNRNIILNLNEKSVDTVYSKLLLADSSEVLSIIERERKELDFQLNDDENAPEKCFIEQALALLNEREKTILNKFNNHVEDVTQNSDNDNTVPVETHHFGIDVSENYVDYFDNNFNDNREHLETIKNDCEELESENHNIVSSDNQEIGMCSSDNLEDISPTADNNAVKYYYFYQAADGQHIYLHSLNIRMLEHMYGSLENCPLNLSGRILEKEGGSMTEELRKRLRYLQHLPITCQFEIAEIQLAVSTVNKETLEFFHDQVETRRKRRQRRARDEKRREKRIAEEENRMMGKYPEVHINYESFHQFPECGVEEKLQASSSPLCSIPVSEPSGSECSSSPLSASCPEEHSAGPSFAKMLASGKAKEISWPKLNNAAPPEPKPRLINITGSQAVTRRIRKNSDSEPEPEDYVPVPAFNKSFGDAIAAALEKSTIDDQNCEVAGNSRSKKKKNRQKILFTTSVRYSEK